MSELAIAETTVDIERLLLHDMCIEQHPGFQISPVVPEADCIDVLEGLMRERLGIEWFEFNDLLDYAGIDSMFGAHIDTPQAEWAAGIAMHKNLVGVGRVALQLAKPGTRHYRGESAAAGPSYTGKLIPGMQTVFSEGLIASGALIEVCLGPAIHEFTTEGDAPRRWRRHTCRRPNGATASRVAHESFTQ